MEYSLISLPDVDEDPSSADTTLTRGYRAGLIAIGVLGTAALLGGGWWLLRYILAASSETPPP
jgi:hypothetical protein